MLGFTPGIWFLSSSIFFQQLRIRGKAWNRGNCEGNSSHNSINMTGNQNSGDWEPEYTQKSKQYYLVELTCFLSLLKFMTKIWVTSNTFVSNPDCSDLLSTTTERTTPSTGGRASEGGDEETPYVGGHDLLFARPLGAPTATAPGGHMTSSRPMGSKVMDTKQRKDRTTTRQTLTWTSR